MMLVCTSTAQPDAFTYQGRLTENGAPASGSNDLRFVLFDALTNGNQISTNITFDDVQLTNGLFTVALDWGAGVFDGSERWRRTVGGPGGQDVAVDLAIDGAGDVLATGAISVSDKGQRFGVVRLAADTGHVLRQRFIEGDATQVHIGTGIAVAVDPRGRVTALGSIGVGPSGARIALLRLPRR